MVLLGSIQKGLEQGILPAKLFVPILEDVATAFNAIKRIAGAVVDAFVDIGEAIATMSEGSGYLIGEFIDSIFKDLGGFVERNLNLATVAIRSLIRDIGKLFTEGFDSTRKARVKAIGEALLRNIREAFEYVVPRLASTVGQVITFGAEVFTNFVEFGARIVAAIGEGIIGALPDMADFIENLGRGIEQAGTEGGVLDAIVDTARQWGSSFLGWWDENAPALAAGIVDVLGEVFDLVGRTIPPLIDNALDFIGSVIGNIARTVEREGPKIVDAFLEWAEEVGPGVLDFLGTLLEDIVELLNGIVAKVGPPLAAAAGAFIDWIAVDVIPNVVGAVARFIDEVVRGLIPLGEEGGALSSPLGDAGGQLVSWITERIPDALDALLEWVGEVELWLIRVALPRLALAFIGLGAALIGEFLEGLLSFRNDPVGTAAGFASRIAEVVGLVLGAAIILKSAAVAGWLVGLAFKGAVILAARTALGVIGVMQWLWTQLTAQAVAAGTAAGLAGSLAMVAAFAIPIVAVILVTIKVAQDVAEAKQKFHDQVSEFIETGTLSGLQSGIAAIEAQIESQKILGIIPFQWAGEVESMEGELERLRNEVRARLIEGARKDMGDPVPLPVGVAASAALITVAIGTALTDFREKVGLFKAGSADLVSDWNSIPDRLKSTADLVREALNKPFDLTSIAADFAANYQLILEAQRSGGVSAIVNANLLRTTMIEDANAINAAFVAAGKAPPLIVDAITGQVTLANTAATTLVDNIETPLDDVKPAFVDAGASASELTAGISDETPAAGRAAEGISNAVESKLKPGSNPWGSWGSAIGRAWVAGISTGAWAAYAAILTVTLGKMFASMKPGGSPPLVGPLKEIDVWGEVIGKTWVDGVVSAIEDGPSKINRAITTVAGALNTTMGGPTVAFAYAGNGGQVTAGTFGTSGGPMAQGHDETVAALGTIAAKLDLNTRLLAHSVAHSPERIRARSGPAGWSRSLTAKAGADDHERLHRRARGRGRRRLRDHAGDAECVQVGGPART